MSPFNDPNLPQGKIHGEGEIHPEAYRNPEVNYDRTDLSARAIVGFLIFLAISGVIMHLVLWGVYKNFAKGYMASSPTANPIASSTRQLPQGDPVRAFPPPRLQPDPVADLNKFRISEEEILNSYGWVDQNAGIARVPIRQAMRALVQQGLPTRQMPPENAQAEQMQAPAAGSDGAMTQQRSNASQ